VIPARYEHVPIRNTHGKYRKLMKHGYSKLLYSQRNKDETIISMIKRLFGEHITSRLVKTQNRELSLRCIAYNIHRLTNIVVISVVSTKPSGSYTCPVPVLSGSYACAYIRKLINGNRVVITNFNH
ncbi:MAG: hypothetical protein WA364_20925, partial [Candidatus Nitrosopolaris sp.]